MTYGPGPTMVYKDFSQKYKWLWFFQRLIHPINISIYWDKKQKVWCREIKNVRGFIKRGWFHPYKGQIVSYKVKV